MVSGVALAARVRRLPALPRGTEALSAPRKLGHAGLRVVIQRFARFHLCFDRFNDCNDSRNRVASVKEFRFDPNLHLSLPALTLSFVRTDPKASPRPAIDQRIHEYCPGEYTQREIANQKRL